MRNKTQSKFIGFLKEKYNAFMDMMRPEGYVCIGCGTELKEKDHERSVCPDCAASMKLHAGNTCRICGDYVSRGSICSRCMECPPHFDKAYALFDYGGLIRKLIISFKDYDSAYLAKYLADYMVDLANAVELSADYFVGVPSIPDVIRKRGYDHIGLLAERFEKRTGLKEVKALVRLTQSFDQTALNYDARYKNVANAFALSPNLPKDALLGKNVLLIDDLMTTGATASACAKVLKEAGAKSVTVLTIAR